MRRTNKRIFAFGSLLIFAFGACKGFLSKNPSKHSFEWINNLTDKEWETEREIIRRKLCNPKYDDAMKVGFQNLLRLFDKVKSEREWAGLKPQGPAYHREHGYNLYKP